MSTKAAIPTGGHLQQEMFFTLLQLQNIYCGTNDLHDGLLFAIMGLLL